MELFFTLYDLNNTGKITKKDFVKMLLNYPKEDLNQITDNLVTTLDKSKKLDNFESVAQLKDLNVVKELQREAANIRKNSSGGRDRLKLEADPLSEKEVNPVVNSRPRGNSFDKGKPGAPKIEKLDSHMIQCTTINNRIKQYASTFFEENDPSSTGSVGKEGFKKWMESHLNIIEYFKGNFYLKIWKSKGLSGSNGDRLGFKDLKPDTQSYTDYEVSPGKTSRIWIEVHSKFLILLKSKEENVPFSKQR